MRSRGVAVGVLGIIVGLSACDAGPGFEQAQYGIVTLTQEARPESEFDADATAIFFRAERSPLPSSRDAGAACVIASATPPPPTTPGFEAIAAGDTIRATARGTTMRLIPAAQAQLTRYGRVEDEPLVVAPDDDILIVVPGASGGFPAASVTVAALAPPVFDVVSVPAEGEPLELTWEPAGTSITRMRIALRYTPAAGGAAEEVVCQVPDAGSFSIPDAFLGGWRAAAEESRSGIGSRWRSEETLRGESVLAAYVQVESSIPVAP